MSYQQVNDRLIPNTQYATPATGATITVNSNGFTSLFINPAGTIATLTITLPGSPSDGDRVQIGASQIITAVTMNGGTILGGLTTMGVGGFATYVYSSSGAEWFRMG